MSSCSYAWRMFWSNLSISLFRRSSNFNWALRASVRFSSLQHFLRWSLRSLSKLKKICWDLLQEIDDLRVGQEVDACSWEQNSELIALLKGTFNRINLLLVLESLLLLLGLNDPVLQHLHRLKELIECQLRLVL
jgi:hypothetical protein